MTTISTWVPADNTSEIDEQFQVVLRNPVTSGISKTGSAQIDDLTGTATITIGASNEPHGVVEFQQSSRRVTVSENKKIWELSVARLYGNIGKTCLWNSHSGRHIYCIYITFSIYTEIVVGIIRVQEYILLRSNYDCPGCLWYILYFSPRYTILPIQ